MVFLALRQRAAEALAEEQAILFGEFCRPKSKTKDE